MKINEIFLSISGESLEAGKPAIFIRAHGCNLHCSYCDSLYAVDGEDYTEMPVSEILNEVNKYGCKKIIFTGGEPLIQDDAHELITTLINNSYSVEVETNGAVDLVPFNLIRTTKEYFSQCDNGYGHYDEKLIFTMDWKCPSSKMHQKMISNNLKILNEHDAIKFVVGSLEDLEDMKQVAQQTVGQVFVSPVFGQIEPKDIVAYVLDNDLWNVRCQVQLHKILYDPNERGV